jgi:hypothetical protein
MYFVRNGYKVLKMYIYIGIRGVSLSFNDMKHKC